MESSKSILVGNGLDIQVGGNDYLNKWIMIRLMAKAQMGKYDSLFENTISGEEIVGLFNGMLDIANKTRIGEYNSLINECPIKGLTNDLSNAVSDFAANHQNPICSVDEIGMEDWILLFQIYLLNQSDLLDQYEAIKQGYERMLLDSIFCEGKIQKLHERMSKKAKEYFMDFDNIFTLNYDNLIEKATRCKVFHLHGDFKTIHMSENPTNAIGYYRRKNHLLSISPIWKHCFSTAILDYSGNLKYKYATQISKCYSEFEKIKQMIRGGQLSKEAFLASVPKEQIQYYELGIEKDLCLGQNFYFDQFENLSGELTIIGLSPYNDSHIFNCINKSNIDVVKFYHYFGTTESAEIEKIKYNVSLNIDKPYVILNIQDLWEELELKSPSQKTFCITERQLCILNDICLSEPITREELLYQVNSIPSTTRKIIMEMLNTEIQKEKFTESSTSVHELAIQMKRFGKTLGIASLSPQSLYYLYLGSEQRTV